MHLLNQILLVLSAKVLYKNIYKRRQITKKKKANLVVNYLVLVVNKPIQSMIQISRLKLYIQNARPLRPSINFLKYNQGQLVGAEVRYVVERLQGEKRDSPMILSLTSLTLNEIERAKKCFHESISNARILFPAWVKLSSWSGQENECRSYKQNTPKNKRGFG